MSARGWLGLDGRPVGWLWLTLAVIALDQWTKHLVLARFEEFERLFLHPMLDLVRLHNRGAAFSFLDDASGWQHWLFIGLGLGVSIGILIWLGRLPRRGHHVMAAGLALVMGGALGNVIDRVLWGYVVDFIHVHYGEWYFPAFNAADAAITVGAGLLILDSVVLDARRRRRVEAEAETRKGRDS